LKDQYVYWNETEKFTLPLYKDLENDVYISAALDGLSYLPLFINFKPSKRRFTFSPEQKHEGTYTIKVTLTESTGYTSVSDTFKLYVLSREYENFNPNHLWMNVTLDVNKKGDLKMNFDTTIHEHEKLELNTTNLDIFLSGMGEDNYNLTWKITEIFEREIRVKLKFDNPSCTGLFDQPDYLNVTFKNNETIRGEGAEYIHSALQNTWVEIPRQTELSVSQYKIAYVIGQIIFYFCVFVFSINALGKIFFGASMRYAIKMLQVFQINEYLPLFHVNMPTFTIFFYKTISYTNW
jgi:hypothetical protein